MAGGRPVEYKPEFCETVEELGAQGLSYTAIAVELDVHRDTMYAWRDTYPEFSDALSRARQKAQAWWEKQGMAGMWADKFNAAVWSKSMSCRFPEDYSDKNKVELTGKEGGAIQSAVTVEFVTSGKDTTT